MSAHQQLRTATRAAHDRVDALFSSLSLGQRGDYARFLLAQAAAFLPAEGALSDAGAAALIPDWDAMRRAPALRADLEALGLSVPAPVGAIAYSGPAEVLGGAYVLEGSRLGGAMLRRAVGEDLPRQFLDSVQPPGRWRAFVARLDRELYDSASIVAATGSATRTFNLFERVKWDELT